MSFLGLYQATAVGIGHVNSGDYKSVSGENIWLLSLDIKLDGKLSKKLGWQHTKNTVTLKSIC